MRMFSSRSRSASSMSPLCACRAPQQRSPPGNQTPQPARSCNQLAQSSLCDPPFGIRPAQALHLRSSGLDDPPVRNSRRADRLARAAAKAEVDVLDLLFVERQLFALPLSHQVDAAAGRFSLQAGDAKRRACVQAQAAVHAGGQVVIAQALERFQITYRPGLRMCVGSNAPFNLLITSSVGGDEPQAPTFSFTSSGAAISTSDPPAASATFRAVMTAAPSSNHQWAIPTPGDAHHRDPW